MPATILPRAAIFFTFDQHDLSFFQLPGFAFNLLLHNMPLVYQIQQQKAGQQGCQCAAEGDDVTEAQVYTRACIRIKRPVQTPVI